MSDVTLSREPNLKDSFDKPDPGVWMKLTGKVLNGAPFEKKVVTQTKEGIALQPVYDRSALEGNPLADTTPGEFPYVRSTSAGGLRTGSWEVCQPLPYPTPGEFNRELLHDIGRGQNSVLLTLDENGRRGVDPATSAGDRGTSIVSAADLETALHGVDLEHLPLHVEAGASAPAAAAALSHSDLAPRKGSVCFDPLARLAVAGELPMSLDAAWDLLAEHLMWMDRNLPGMRSLGVDVGWNVNAGGNAVYDLALMLSSAAESFRALAERNVSPDLAARKALVKFSIGCDTFMEVAKFRAARALWAQLVKHCEGGDEAGKLCQFAATSNWHQTRVDPYVNLLRATSQAFSAVMGGVDGLRVDPFDAPFGLPNTFSRRIARNIQLILRDEAHLAEVVDPAGGSWTVENLTLELGGRAWKLFQEIESAGGLGAMLRDGSLRETLGEQAATQRLLLARRRMVMVGGNQFANLEEKKPEVRVADTAAAARHAARRIDDLKENRDEAAATRAIDSLKRRPTLDNLEGALKHGATFGEAMAALGGADHARVNPVRLGRLTTEYEKLRENMEAYAAENGAAPEVLMAQMGPVKQHKIRSDFSQEFLKPGGFEILADQRFDSAAEAAEAVVERGVAATVICSTDDSYPELVPEFARAVKNASPGTVVLVAGRLPDYTEAFKQAGVDDFIHLKANNLRLLTDLQAKTGVAL